MSRAQLMADIARAQKDASRPLTRLRHALVKYLSRPQKGYLKRLVYRTLLNRGLWPFEKPKTYYGMLTQNPGRKYIGTGWKGVR